MSLYRLLAGPRAESLSLSSIRGWAPVLDSYGVRASATGELVSPQTATALSTYVACQRVIAEDLAKIPVKVFRTRKSGGRDAVTDHPVALRLASEPNDWETAPAFREDFVAAALGWAHGYSRIVRDGNGAPDALIRLDPPRVRMKRDAEGPFYELHRLSGKVEIIRVEDMLDLYGVNAWSAAREGRESLGIALAEQSYAGHFLGQASAPTGIIETPQPMDDDRRKKFREDWVRMQGGAANAGRIAVFEAGMKYHQLAVDPQAAQLLESRQFSVEEICRWFRVSPRKVMDRQRAQGWSTLEHSDVEHVNDCLLPWAVRLEALWDLRLFTEKERRDGFYTKHVLQGMLRGDMKTRVAFYRLLMMTGAISPNEIRSLEDMNPIGPAGDTYWMPLNMAPIEKVISGEAKKQAAPSPDRGGAGGEANTSDGAEDARRFLPIFEQACERILRKEWKAVRRLAANGGDIVTFLEGERKYVARVLAPVLQTATGISSEVAEAQGWAYGDVHLEEAAATWLVRRRAAAVAEEYDDSVRARIWADEIVDGLVKEASDALR